MTSRWYALERQDKQSRSVLWRELNLIQSRYMHLAGPVPLRMDPNESTFNRFTLFKPIKHFAPAKWIGRIRNSFQPFQSFNDGEHRF